MCLVTHDAYTAFPTTVRAGLADSLLHAFFPRVKRDRMYVEQYVSESVQSWDASKQLLQGEEEQKFYTRRNFIAFCTSLFSNPYHFLYFPWETIVINFLFSPNNL